MVRRFNHTTDEPFWGCDAYPDCRGTRRYTESRARESTPPAGAVALPLDVLRQARLLTHPDRHSAERAGVANAVTAAINAALQGRTA